MSIAQLGNGGETVDEALGVRAGALPSGAVVLITDEVAASGGFLVAHFLRRALAAADEASTTNDCAAAAAASASASSSPSPSPSPSPTPTPRVCLVAAEQNVAHYAQALRKLGRNIHSDMAAGRLVVVDTLTQPFGWCTEEGTSGGEGKSKSSTPDTGGGGGGGKGGVYRYTHSGRGTATRDLFDVIARALGRDGADGSESESESGSGTHFQGLGEIGGGWGVIGELGRGGAAAATARRVIVFDSLTALAEAEEDVETTVTRAEVVAESAAGRGGEEQEQQKRDASITSKHRDSGDSLSGGVVDGGVPKSADGRVNVLLRCCASLPSCAVVALAHADAASPAANATAITAGGWLSAVERRADVKLTCRGLDTGSAEDVHGHVHVNHRTGRMMPHPRELTDAMTTTTTLTEAAAAAAAVNGVRGLSLGGGSGGEGEGGGGGGGGGRMVEDEGQFEESEAPPRFVSVRFQLTELGPRVTRIHRPAS